MRVGAGQALVAVEDSMLLGLVRTHGDFRAVGGVGAAGGERVRGRDLCDH